MYYRIGEGHKAFIAEKVADNDFYLFTLAAIARELSQQGFTGAYVHIAAGLPLTWVKTQREDFRSYLTRNSEVRFVFKDKPYHINIVGCTVYPQGYTAVLDKLSEMTGVTSNEVKETTLLAGKYVVFTIAHTAEAMQIAWNEIFIQLAALGHSMDSSRPILERYSVAMIERQLCEICVPI